MVSKNDLERYLTEQAGKIDDLTLQQQSDAVVALMAAVDEFTLGAASSNDIPTPDVRFGATFTRNDDQAVSVTGKNYFINWRKLLFAGGAIPAKYLNETLTAMTVLGFLASGSVHKFDEVEARILAIIVKNDTALPMATRDFYIAHQDQFPADIDENRYMRRITVLAEHGTVDIDDDQLKKPTAIYQIPI